MRLGNLLTFAIFAVAMLVTTAGLQADRSLQPSRVSAQEHPRIQPKFGGAIPDRELVQYVDGIGRKLAHLTPEKDAAA